MKHNKRFMNTKEDIGPHAGSLVLKRSDRLSCQFRTPVNLWPKSHSEPVVALQCRPTEVQFECKVRLNKAALRIAGRDPRMGGCSE